MLIPILLLIAIPLGPAQRDEWRAVFQDGKQVGFQRTRFEPEGDTVVSIRETRIQAGSLRISVKDTIHSKSNGLLEQFESVVESARGTRKTFSGTLADGRLTRVVGTLGRNSSRELLWPSATRSPLWFQRQLPARPMPPQNHTRFSTFAPHETDAFDVRITSGTWRHLKLPDGTRQRLLPLTVRRIDRPSEKRRWYMSTEGRLVLMEEEFDGVPFLLQLVKRAVAQGAMQDRELDLTLARLVRTDRPLEQGRGVRQAVFHISGAGGLERTLNRGTRQQAVARDDGVTEVTIVATQLTTARRHRRVDRVYLKASRLIDHTDPNVSRFAAEAAAGVFDPAQVAAKLQRAVDKRVRNRVFSARTIPASEILLRREGDCTEHAVLLVAALRAQHIPARIAAGLVYVDGQSGFAPHMWVEANINGEWTALDATLGEKLPGAGYLQISHSALSDDDTVIDAFLPVIDLIDRLKIEVVPPR